MKLTVIIATHHSPEALEAVLVALRGQTDACFELIVAEDGTDPATAQVVQRYHATFNLKHITQVHHGMRKCRILNEAIRQSTGEYIVFLDGDCIPHPRFIADHKQLVEPDYFLQARRAFIKESAVKDFIQNRSFSHFLRLAVRGRVESCFKGFWLLVPLVTKDACLRGVIGCNIGIYRKHLEAINGFDEAFEGWGLEDSDLAARLYHLGVRRKKVYGRAIVYHLNHPKQHLNVSNQARLADTLRSGRVDCKNGLVKKHP